MGCCSSTLTNKAFRRDLSLPLLEELSSSMKDLPDARVFILRLNCLKNLRPTGISGQINAYVDVKLLKPDDIAGPQLQASSIKPKSANPKWVSIFSYLFSDQISTIPSFSFYLTIIDLILFIFFPFL